MQEGVNSRTQEGSGGLTSTGRLSRAFLPPLLFSFFFFFFYFSLLAHFPSVSSTSLPFFLCSSFLLSVSQQLCVKPTCLFFCGESRCAEIQVDSVGPFWNAAGRSSLNP